MFCCSRHQREHECVEHNEYFDLLDLLPIICYRCHCVITTISELKTACVRFNTHGYSALSCANGTYKSERKRVLKSPCIEKTDNNYCPDSPRSRKKLIPSRKLKKKSVKSPSLIIIDISQAEMIEDIKKSIFSPQFNVSFRILNDDVKSSTPLYENKENLPVIAILENDDLSTYTTPETARNSSVIVISATKKNSITENISKRKKSRKVTFEKVEPPKSPELDVSAYSSPLVSPEVIDEVESELKNTNLNTESQECTVTELLRNLRLAIREIPRSLWNAYDWSLKIIRNNSDNSFGNKRKKEFDFDESQLLKRRPISSYWVNMSIGSLMRSPLPRYLEKYDVLNKDCGNPLT